MDSTTEYGAPPNLRSGRAAKENERWSNQIQNEEEARTVFEPSVTLQRSLVQETEPATRTPSSTTEAGSQTNVERQRRTEHPYPHYRQTHHTRAR